MMQFTISLSRKKRSFIALYLLKNSTDTKIFSKKTESLHWFSVASEEDWYNTYLFMFVEV